MTMLRSPKLPLMVALGVCGGLAASALLAETPVSEPSSTAPSGISKLPRPSPQEYARKAPTFSVTLTPTVRQSGSAQLWLIGVTLRPDGGWTYPSSAIGSSNGARTQLSGIIIPSAGMYRITAEVEASKFDKSSAVFQYAHVIQNPDGSSRWSDYIGQKRFEYTLRTTGRTAYTVDVQLEPGQHTFEWQFDGAQALISFSVSN
jgi:hypothetical protein